MYKYLHFKLIIKSLKKNCFSSDSLICSTYDPTKRYEITQID